MRLLQPLALAALVVACLMFAGCKSPEEEFLERCIPLVRRTTDGVFGAGIPNAAPLAKEAQEKGIDLYGLYEVNPDDRHKRLSLGYLLLLQESEEYLSFARANRQRLLETGELYMFTWVLGQEYDAVLESSGVLETDFNTLFGYRGCLSEGYRAAMLELLIEEARTARAAPFASFLRVVLAEKRLASGEIAEGIASLLDTVCEGADGGATAYEVLWHIPASQSATILLPYLDGKSPKGAYAASLLIAHEEHEDQARQYLEMLKASEDATLATAAEDASQLSEYWSSHSSDTSP